jgi:hypothetical protein
VFLNAIEFSADPTTVLLQSLHALVDFYLPCLLVLGYQVRKLLWDGAVGGTVQGQLAKDTLAQCLAVQVHLTGDWGCKLEYTRTLSVALLTWQPWLSNVPGCCFAEEPCEAMLARMVARCRRNRQLSSFEDVLQLYVSLPPPDGQARPTGCNIRPQLIDLMRTRVLRLLQFAPVLPFARVTNAKDYVWMAHVPTDFQQGRIPADPKRTLTTVLQAALVSLTTKSKVPADLMQAAAALFGDSQFTPFETSRQDRALQTVREWGAKRRQVQQTETCALERATSSRATMGPSLSQSSVPPLPPAVRLTAEVLRAAARNQDTEDDVLNPIPVASDGASLYMPPESDALSAGYQSFGDTDSLGEVGELV